MDAATPSLPPPSPLTADDLVQAARRPAGGGIEVEEDLGGRVVGISGRLARDVHANDEPAAAAAWLESFGKQAWGWSGGGNIGELTGEQASYPVEKSSQTDQLVVRPVRYVQLHAGIPIEDRQGAVTVGRHTRDPAFIVGGYVGNFDADPVPAGASAIPGKTVLEALTEAARDPKLAAYNAVGPNGPNAMYKGRLVWVEAGGRMVLAYRILLDFASLPVGGAVKVLADASTGALLEVREVSETAIAVIGASTFDAPVWKGPSPTPVTGSTVIYTPPFGGFSLSGNAIAERIQDGTGIFFAAGPSFISEPYLNDFAGVYAPFRYTTDAYGHARTTFAWLRRVLGWIGVDGGGRADLPLYPFATTEFNASADPRGNLNLHSGVDGAGNPAAVGLSVIAHEIGHQVGRWVNPLDYRNDSGALNEALADFNGQMVRDFPDFIGDDIDGTTAGALRSFADPPLKGQPDRYSRKTAPSRAPTKADDYGGVHANSGIVNKAHWLMVRGSKGAAFNGFELAPLGLEGTRKLVYAAMFAGLFPSNSTLPAYGAGLYGFCRAQTAMWKGLALTSEQACGSVHDAFAATELIGASAAATDVSMEVEADGNDDGKIAAKIRVYNSGTARYQGPVRFDLRSDVGTTIFDSTSQPDVTYQPRSRAETAATFAIGDVARNLPYDARLTVSIAPGVDTVPSNNTVTLKLAAEVLPASDRATLLLVVGGKAGIRVSASRAGNCPLEVGDISGRLLYRKKGSTRFEWGAPATSIVRVDDATGVPSVADFAGKPVFAEPLRDDFVAAAGTAVPVATYDRQFVLPSGDFRRFGVLALGKDGKLRTGFGSVVDDDLVFVAFDYDGRMNVSGSETLLYCLNCDASDPGNPGPHFEYSGVNFANDTKLADVLPADLAVVWANLAPSTRARTPVYMNPGFQNWLKLGGFGFGGPGLPGDPPLFARGGFLNPGP